MILELINQLVTGWRERVEYQAAVRTHDDECVRTREGLPASSIKHLTCACSASYETRVESRWQPALLTQLCGAAYADLVTNQGERVNCQPVIASVPLNIDPLDLVDGIRSNAGIMVSLFGGVVKPSDTTMALLRHLAVFTANAAAPEHLVHDTERMLRKSVGKARIMLGYDAPERTLRDTVCGECGGRLAVAFDASTDVRCTACGHKYRRWEWIDLLDQSS